MRPVYRVKKNKLLITKKIASEIMNNELSWEDLLVNNKINQTLIEYIDAAEQNYS